MKPNEREPFLKNSFLGRAFRQDPMVAAFVVSFAVLQGFAQLFTAEVTPFFLYGMYSEVLDPRPTYVRVSCHIDGAPLVQEDLPRYAGELFFSTLERYQRLEANGGSDFFRLFLDERFAWLPSATKEELDARLAFHPDQRPELERWMHRYLERVLDRDIDTIRVDREIYRYIEQHPVLVERKNLITATR